MRTKGAGEFELKSPIVRTTASSVSVGRTPAKPKIRNFPKRVGKSASATLLSLRSDNLYCRRLRTALTEAHVEPRATRRAFIEDRGVHFTSEHRHALWSHAAHALAR